MSYPILLDLRGRLVIVVGGGRVAARKVTDLLEAGAQIILISPTLTPILRRSPVASSIIQLCTSLA